MSTRYLTNVALMIAGGVLVVATAALAAPTGAALTFAVTIGLTIVSLYMLVAVKSIAQRVIGGVGVVLGAWTILASLVFVPATATSLGFAAAIAFVGLGLIGLTAHELTSERVVHALEVVTKAPAARQRGRNGKAVAA